jgi:hypothetical protein
VNLHNRRFGKRLGQISGTEALSTAIYPSQHAATSRNFAQTTDLAFEVTSVAKTSNSQTN